MEFIFVPLKQNTVKNAILGHTRLDFISTSLAITSATTKTSMEEALHRVRRLNKITAF